MPLAEFFSRVGIEAYEGQWPAEQVTLALSQRRLRAGDRQGPGSAVAADLGLAGSSGILRAVIELVLPSAPAPTEKLHAADEDNVAVEDLLAALGDDDDDDDTPLPPTKRLYAVDPEFWDIDWVSCVDDWRASRLRVPITQVSETVGNPYTLAFSVGRPLTAVRSDLALLGTKDVVGRVIVLHAERLIGEMFPISDLPADMWKARNKTFPNRLVDEVVSAAWRALAIEKPNSSDISRASDT